MVLSINDVSIFADGLDHPECIVVHPDGSVWAGAKDFVFIVGQKFKYVPVKKIFCSNV